MDKRYQVFVSSTYLDLIEARSEVMQALLELDCMPAGMELFPAANDDQWTWIQKIIDESDYYIVIIGGRYGSVSDSTGLSFTEMEYRYAVEKGKPVIGFLHEDPSSIPAKSSEQDPKLKEKLNTFRKYVQSRLCKHWSSPADLGAKVSRSITQLLKQYPAVGWIRANQLSPVNSAEEVLRLRRQIDTLTDELAEIRKGHPQATPLANGKDQYSVSINFKRKKKNADQRINSWVSAGKGSVAIPLSWDEIFAYFAPSLIQGVSTWQVDQILNQMASKFGLKSMESVHPGERFEDIQMTDECRKTILVQLRALKLIDLPPDESGWRLTEAGDRYMTQLLAIPKTEKTAGGRVKGKSQSKQKRASA